MKTTRLQFQRATDPGQTPPELDALGFFITQNIEGVQVYKLVGSHDLGNGYHQPEDKLWLTVQGGQMWLSAAWMPQTLFSPYDIDVIREYVLETHKQYQDYSFKPIPPTDDEIFQDALNYNCSDNTPEQEEEATPFERYGLAFREA
jgi:hypothetical protein